MQHLPAAFKAVTHEGTLESLKDARRLDYVAGLRISYRQYGLEDETERAIKDLQ
jgi:hypothetical protein